MDLSALVQQVFKKSVLHHQPLESGLSNDNTLITLDNGERFVVRTPRAQTEHFFDRLLESQVIERIRSLNLDVECHYFDSTLGIKITRYIENAHHFSECKLSLSEKMNSVAFLLRRLHNAAIEGYPSFNPFERLRQYRQTIKIPIPGLCNAEWENALQRRWELSPKILCHNDVVSGNLLFTSNRAYLIDYEYAGSNDPFFDVASFLSENNLVDGAKIQEFLAIYLIRVPLAEELEHLMNWIHFQDLLWANWAMVMYEQYHQPIYLNIFHEKTTRYHLWQSNRK